MGIMVDLATPIGYSRLFLLLACFDMGCSKGIKKAEFVPGEEWIADMRERIEASILTQKTDISIFYV